MDVNLAVLLLVALALAWAYLPFMPSVCELLEIGDSAPVPVPTESEVNVRHHAEGFRKFMEAELSSFMVWSRADGRRQAGELADHMSYLVLPEGEDNAGDLGRHTPSRTVLVATGSLNVPEDSVHLAEVFADGPISSGARTTFRAVLSENSIELGPDSRTLRWLDAGRTLRAGQGTRLDGRASAGEAIELASGCRFERLWAPRIVFGRDRFRTPARVQHSAITPDDLGVPVEVAAGRWLVRHPLVIQPGTVIEADLVVTGPLTVGDGCRITGSLKSHRDVRLGAEVVVDGSVVSERNIDIEEGCDLSGPVLAEEAVSVAAGCRIGRPGRLTTLSARRVRIDPGVVVHGTVWAHDDGLLETENA